MIRLPSSNPHLRPALDRFPEDAALVMSRALHDPSFRGVCEDYALAQGHLKKLQMATAESPEALSDYVTLVADLEAELTRLIEAAREERRV